MKNNFKIDFVGIGAAKSGTTWVADMLDKHPAICLSEPKEVNYFNYLVPTPSRLVYRRKKKSIENKNFSKSVSWYEKHFLHYKPGNLRGDFSTVYFYDEKAPTAIKNLFPEVKLIVCLRNPIDRAYSEYWMLRSSFKIERRSFERLLEEENSMLIEKGKYYNLLSRYLNYFKREKILIIFFEDIKKQPEVVLKRVYDYLGVDSSFVPVEIRNKSNRAKVARWKGVVRMMNASVKFLANLRLVFLVRFLKKIGFNKLLLRLTTTKLTYPPMDLQTRQKLRLAFEDDIQQLEKLLNKDLSHWV